VNQILELGSNFEVFLLFVFLGDLGLEELLELLSLLVITITEAGGDEGFASFEVEGLSQAHFQFKEEREEMVGNVISGVSSSARALVLLVPVNEALVTVFFVDGVHENGEDGCAGDGDHGCGGGFHDVVGRQPVLVDDFGNLFDASFMEKVPISDLLRREDVVGFVCLGVFPKGPFFEAERPSEFVEFLDDF